MGTLTINPVYNPSVTVLNNAGNPTNLAIYQGYTTAVNLAINYFTTTFNTLGTSNVTLNIGFGWGDVTPGTPVTSGGASNTTFGALTYAQTRTMMTTAYNVSNNANVTALQTNSLNVLPGTDPTSGATILIAQGQRALLDPAFAATVGTTIVGYSGLSVSTYNWNQNPAGFGAGQSDAVGIDEHEISEVLGRSMYRGVGNEYSLLDFYSYTAQGNSGNAAIGTPVGIQNVPWVVGNSTTIQSYFSPGGVTVTLPFRSPTDNASSDLADWGAGGPGGTISPQATVISGGQTLVGGDSYNGAGSGVSPISTTDTQVMSVIAGLVIVQCFASGTHIATPGGTSAVEHLAEGDLVRTASGENIPIKWIGHRAVDCARHPRPADVWPIRVVSDAFGPGQPYRDVYLSPDHAVFVEGVLIPIRHLTNGTSIRQEQRDFVTYWHIELPQHDILIAEGLAAESFLDTGNRGAFINAGRVVQAHPNFSRHVWEAEGYAKLVASGPELEAARVGLAARAHALGMDQPAFAKAG